MQTKSLFSFIFKTIFAALVLCAILLGSATFANGLETSNGANGSSGKHICTAPDCCPEENRMLKLVSPPMNGDDVREYQIALKKLGLYNGALNGVFDRLTEGAVKEFQHRYGLKCDGTIGRETMRAMAQLFEAAPTRTKVKQAPSGNVMLVINIDKKTLTVYDGNKVFKKYPVAVGKSKTPTPIGEFRISRKAKNWGTGFGTRWMGLNVPWGIYGIHGTNKPWSVGSRASHGCIRMLNSHVEELYEWVKPGTTVCIEGRVYHPLYEERKPVLRGDKGTVVVLVQQGLIAEGYLKGNPDGIFGRATEDALKRLQKDRGVEVTGQVNVDIWPILGL